ncbi:MAG: hypothetical protein CL508_05170 [Actinobacteria bacterium]|nr:hypothetical protein [Actinomycetota bacterium]|tara:strand:- start:9087 stop:15578 length:6492 start_codon:yes stop_codon:yes gene_type:complete
MSEIRWWWQPTWSEELEEETQNERFLQATQFVDALESNPNIASNLKGLIEENFYLPRDILIGSALMGLTSDSPELAPLVERWLDVEKTWWDRTKGAMKGAVRGAFVAFDSIQDELVKKPILSTQKYLNDRKHQDGQGLVTAMTQLLFDKEAQSEWQKTRQHLGPSVGREAIKKALAGEKVNLGEGFFGNSTLAENTDIYKEMVGRGADPEEVKKIVQSYYGEDITNSEQARDESLTIKSKHGTVKLTPAAQLFANILEPGSKSYNISTGIVDGLFTLVADPTILIGGYLSKAGKVTRSLSQGEVLKGAGIVNKAVRKTVHVPSAVEYVTRNPGGRKIVEQLVKAEDYGTVGRLLGKRGSSGADAILHKNLKLAKTTREVEDLLVAAIEGGEITKKLNPTSLMFRGKVSSKLGSVLGGELGEAIGLSGVIRRNMNDTALGRIFETFPAPKLQVNDFNQSFFDLQDWMRFARVDDVVAEKALDDLAELALSQKGASSTTKAQAVRNMNEILNIWDDVQRHIAQKFENIGLPPQLMKGVKNWMASIDETRMYFTNTLGELEYFPGSKIEDLPFMTFFAEQLTDDEAMGLVARVLTRYRKSNKIDTDELDAILEDIKSISNNATTPEDRALVEYVTGGYYEGVEQAGLNIAEEIGIKTSGAVPYGYRGKGGTIDAQRMRELGLDDLSETEKARQLKNLSNARQDALSEIGMEVAKLPRKLRSKMQRNMESLDGLEVSTRNLTDKIQGLKVQIDEIAKQFKSSPENIKKYKQEFPESTTKEAKEAIAEQLEDALRPIKDELSTSIKDRTRVDSEISRLTNEIQDTVPSYKGLSEVEKKNLYDEKFWEQDFATMKLDKQEISRVSRYNLDNADMTIIFTGAAKGGQGMKQVINYLEKGTHVIEEGIKGLKPGVYQGHKPYAVVDLSAGFTKQQAEEIQRFAELNNIKSINISGPSDFTIAEEALMKTAMEDIFFVQKQFDSQLTIGNVKSAIDNALDNTKPADLSSRYADKTKSVAQDLQDEISNNTDLQKIANNIKPKPTAHLISEYFDQGVLPMPDARLFLRVFRPMRDLMLRLSGRAVRAGDDYERLLAKPVTNLAELALKDDKTAVDTIKLAVKKARLNIKLSGNEDEVAEITEGIFTMVGDGYMQRIWKPSILLRPAWVVRVVGEEQIRMWAEGLDNVFAHPFSAFAWVLGRKPSRNAKFLKSQREKLRDDYLADTLNLGRGGTDIFDESLDLALEHAQAMTTTHGGMVIGFDPKRARGFTQVTKTDKRFYGGGTKELLQLADDPLATRIAQIEFNPVRGKEDFNLQLQKIKDDFWDGNLREWREAFINNTDDLSRGQKAIIGNSRAHADSYIDSVVARLHDKTGGKYRAVEYTPDGKFVGNVWDENSIKPTIQNENNIIKYIITQSGDEELIGHIARNENQFIKILNNSGEEVSMKFTREMSESQYKQYKEWLAKRKNGVWDDTHHFKTSRTDVTGDVVGKYDRALETAFTTLMGVPTNDLSRSPAFRQFYWRFIENMYANLDNAARTQVFAQAKKMMGRSLPGSRARKYLKSLENMGQANASKLLGVDDLRQVDELAKAYALTETKSLLYDLNKRHVITDMVRLVMPFAEVYLEIAGTWTRLLKNQKMLFGRKVQRTVEGMRKPSLFGEYEDEGFFTTDPQSGEEMFNMNLFENIFSLDRSLNNPNPDALGINPITGRETTEVPEINTKLRGYATGLNMVAGDIIPGLGPLAQIPAAAILPSTPDIDRTFFPYGRPEEGLPHLANPIYYAKQAIPSYFRKVISAADIEDPEFQRAYVNQVKEIQRAMFMTNTYDDSTPEQEVASLEKAKKLATQSLLHRAFIQWIAPTGAVIQYDYQIGPGGRAYLDPRETEGDPEGKYFAQTLLADAYYQMLAKAKGDRVVAIAQFIKVFGFDPTALLTSKSKQIKKVSFTDEGGYFKQENEEIFKKYPDVAYYMYPDSPLDEFNWQAWNEAFSDGDRVDLTPEQYKQAVRQAQGSLAYEHARRVIMDGPMYASLPYHKRAEQLYLIRLQLQKQFPGYGDTSTAPQSLTTEAKIKQITEMIQRDGDSSITLPDGSTKKLKDMPSMKGIVKYLSARQRVLNIIKSEHGINATLSRAEASEYRSYLRGFAQKLMLEHPDFYFIYFDVFRVEVEEEMSYYGEDI